MKINKKIIYFVIIILIIILGIFIYKNMIKNKKFGNNINSQEIVDYILNINSYKSEIMVEVNSNKNKNKYILKQEFSKSENTSIQEVIEPSNISGIRIIRNGENLTLENSFLNISTFFENYKGLEENALDLISFIEDYKNNINSQFNENEKEIILKTKNQNKYMENKILYIDKQTKLPSKLIIEDNNKKMRINIQYNNIAIN